jgi:hypothetical protein
MFPPDVAAWGGTLAVALVIYWIYVNKWQGSGIHPSDRSDDLFNHVTYPIKALVLLLENIQPPNIYVEVRKMKVNMDGLWRFMFETQLSDWAGRFGGCTLTLQETIVEDSTDFRGKIEFKGDKGEDTVMKDRVDGSKCPTYRDVYKALLEKKEGLCGGDLSDFASKIRGLTNLLQSVRNTVLANERREHSEMTAILDEVSTQVKEFCGLLNAFTQNTSKEMLNLEQGFEAQWILEAQKYKGRVIAPGFEEHNKTAPGGREITLYNPDDIFMWVAPASLGDRPNHHTVFEELKKKKDEILRNLEAIVKKK